MAAFDFNDFQKSIFLQVFNNPMQKAPETEGTFKLNLANAVKPKIKASNVGLEKKELMKKGRGRPKGSIRRKIEENEEISLEKENAQKKTRKALIRINKNKNIYKKTYGNKNDEEKFSEEKVRIQKTSFEVHQQEESNDSTVRRSLRTKLMMRASIDVLIEIIEKPFDEMNQPEFLHYFQLQKIKC